MTKAIIAVAASILTAVWAMLRNGSDYVDLGPDHFVGADRVEAVNRLLKKTSSLGFDVTGIRETLAA